MQEPESDPSPPINDMAPLANPQSSPIPGIGFWLGPALCCGWLSFVDPGSLTPEAHRLAGVLWLTITWWLTEPIPIPATALLSVVLSVALGAVPAGESGKFEPSRTALAPFADPSVFFLLGGLFIGRGMARHGLDRRMALSVLCSQWAGRSPGTVLAAVGLSVMAISMWISNTAATAMMYPVTLGMISVLAAGQGPGRGDFARSPYATGLLLMTAYASSVGGIATPIGTATNIVAIGYLKQPEYLGRPIDFLQWSLVGVPMALLIFGGLFGLLRLHSPAGHLQMATLRGHLHREYALLGPWKAGEVNTLIVFLTVVTLWVTPGALTLAGWGTMREAFSRRLPEEIAALLAPVLLFLLPIDWKRRRFSLEPSDLQKIDWGTILLFGAGLSLGNLMFKTGLAQHVGQGVFDALGTRDVWVITAVAIAAGILLSEFTSNTAAAVALLPVILTICRQAEIDAVWPLMGVTFGASFGSALPVSTPPNAIVYGSGLIPIGRMIAAGVAVDLVCGVAIWTVLRVAALFQWSPLVP